MLKIIGTSLIGIIHRKRSGKLQDFFDIYLNYSRYIYYNDSRIDELIIKGVKGIDYAFVFVADGAGSARYGGDGARYAVNSVMNFVKGKAFDNDTPEQLLRQILKVALDGVRRGANELNASIDDLATTFIALYTRGKECFSVSVGDGFVIIDDGNELRLLNEPVKGEYFNETQFITSPEVIRAIEDELIEVRSSGCNAFAVATDGLWPTIINGKPYERFYRPVIDYLRVNDVDRTADELVNLLRSAQGRYPSVYDDDLTLVVGAYE
ncbi:PP2C family serine/threonine-protein phosphatase [Vulcanisaeta sp. JCM 16159]|uniref:PP2C family serine/threonine-protein phosphatase n=1 Tax=Vulcanisaeta sp. JCM 16159 TaxID=1295371 RepID=UPI0006CF356B|nr:PP2C family serine/threonine-protein phosphatase [Vulcanisaeta sp. JCM 16159]